MTVMQQDDLPDSSSFVSLSRTLQEKLWSEEGSEYLSFPLSLWCRMFALT